MNDKAREALVAAALTGVKQIKNRLDDGKTGRCAMGVLYESVGLDLHWNLFDKDMYGKIMRARRKLGLTGMECLEIMDANDNLGWDFLTIARKIGTNDSE